MRPRKRTSYQCRVGAHVGRVDQRAPNEAERLELRNAQAVAWVSAVLADETATDFFDLPMKAQSLAVQLLATSARVSLSMSAIEHSHFTRILMHEWTEWITE